MRIDEELADPRFVNYRLLETGSRFFNQNAQQTVGMASVNQTQLAAFPVPLPPLDQQRLIVSEIEKHFTRLDAAVASLKQTQAKLKAYRAAVLKTGVAGRLLPREHQRSVGENDGAELLRSIAASRRSKWEAHQLASMQSAGRLPKDEKWKRRYKEPAAPPLDLPVPPSGWAWVTLDQLAWSVKDGPHFSPPYVEQGGVPFITGGNVRPHGVDFDSAKQISWELHRELSKRCRPEIGDILYTKGGTTGIARVNTYDKEFNVWVHVAVLKLADGIDAFYLQHALNSPSCYAQAQKYTHGVGNQDLGLTRMINISLLLPPLDEQKGIVAEIDRRLSLIEEAEQQVNRSLIRTSSLRQAVLHAAFAGQLLTSQESFRSSSVPLSSV